MKTISFALLFLALNSNAADSSGYKASVSCVSQTESAQVKSNFKTKIAGEKAMILSVAKIDGVEIILKEIPTAGPLGLGIFASSDVQKEMALGRFYMTKETLEVQAQTKAGSKDLSIKCRIIVSE